ncbi:MAG: DSD1 family PLP-dependent enzyme [Acidimicrobiales bacterium]
MSAGAPRGAAGPAGRDEFVDAVAHNEWPDARRRIPTPALVLDVDLLDANVERMARLVRDAGVALRPQVKSHKSAFVARRQLEAGAVGLACAKLSEAEAIVAGLAGDGYDRPVSILVTSPLVGRDVARRAADLARRCGLLVVADHPDGVDELALALVAEDATAGVVCDVDVGLGRTGVVDPAHALAVAERVSRSPQLDFAGVQGYGGHLQHIVGRDARRDATRDAMSRLRAVIDAMVAAGFPMAVVTGGGTGTSLLDIELDVLTELQPGSYVFMDRQYADALGEDPEGCFDQSLTLETTVISANHDGYVTVDAGLKSMATDAGPPRVAWPAGAGEYQFFGDEHGLVTYRAGHPLARGERVALVPPHCDPTVDRYDHLWLVRGASVVGLCEVTARGCSQ